jgi:hypothetical protein
VCDQVDEVVKLLDFFGRGGLRCRQEDGLLRVIGEPLIVKLLKIGPVVKALGGERDRIGQERAYALWIGSNLVLEVDSLGFVSVTCRRLGIGEPRTSPHPPSRARQLFV